MNTLKLDINELEIDENQNQIFTKDFNRYFDFNESFKTQIILPPNSLYRTIAFDEVTSPVAFLVVSDKLINVKLNSFEITNTKMVLLNTSINSLQIANIDDVLNANVTVYIWGVQQ